MKDLGISVVIGAALSGSFNTVLGRSISQFNRLGSAIGQAEDRSRHITVFRRLKTELAATETAYHKAKANLAGLSREMQKSGKPTRRMRAAMADAHREVQVLSQKLNEQRNSLSRQRAAMKSAGMATANLNRQEKLLGGTLDRLRQRYGRLGEAMKRRDAVMQKRAGLRAQLVDAVALGVTVAAPIKAAIRFESVMADVKKVVNFDSPTQFKTMRKDILKLSTVIPMAAEGLGDIMAAAGQAGIARGELLRFASDAAKMGVAFDMTGKEAGSAMAGLRTIFHLNQDQVVSLGDAYNHLSNTMDATARDMLAIANRTGSTADLFGLTGQQVGALSATFLALKTRPEIAATGINALLLKLQTADKQGRKFQEALAGIGMDASTLKQAIERDAQGALLNFLEAVKSSDDVTGTLSDLFGLEYSDDMAKLVGGLDLYRKALGLVAKQTDYAGSMQKEYKQRAETTENSLKLFRNQVYRLGITIGSVLLPPLNTLLGTVGKAVGGIASLAEKFPLVTTAIVGLTTGLIAMKVAAIAGGYAWTFVKGAWLAGLVALRSLRAGVALANSGLKLLNATALITGMRVRALAIGGAIKGFASALVGLASRAIPLVIGGVRALTAAMMSNPIGLIVGGIATAAFLIYEYWTPIKAFFGKLWDGVKSIFGVAWEAIKTLFFNYTPKGLVISHWQEITGFFGRLWNGIKSIFGTAWESIAAMTKGWGQSLFAIGRSIIDGLVGGITAGIAAVKDTVVHIGSSVVGGVKEFFGIKSPSRVFMGLGRHLSQGLALGINQGERGVLGSMRRIQSVIAKPLAMTPMRLAAPALIAATTALSAASAPASIAASPAREAAATRTVIYNNHGSTHYNITVNLGGDAANPANLRAAIRRILQEHDEERHAKQEADLRRLLHD